MEMDIRPHQQLKIDFCCLSIFLLSVIIPIVKGPHMHIFVTGNIIDCIIKKC